MNVTRDVITDLWPVYASGEASPDTRALVEAFLQGDPEFARLIQGRVPKTSGGRTRAGRPRRRARPSGGPSGCCTAGTGCCSWPYSSVAPPSAGLSRTPHGTSRR